jgi:hypothetical protein
VERERSAAAAMLGLPGLVAELHDRRPTQPARRTGKPNSAAAVLPSRSTSARFQAEAKDRVRQQRTALSHAIMLLVSEGFNGP